MGMRNEGSGTESVVFQTALGWAGVIASDLGVVRVILPKKSRKAVETELVQIPSVHGSSAKVRAPRSSLRRAGDHRTTFSPRARGAGGSEKLLLRAKDLLERYFSGKTMTFDLPLAISGYTAFQQAVWHAASEIPFGETRSYGWIAKRIRKPNSSRAVGQAMGANPLPILVP